MYALEKEKKTGEKEKWAERSLQKKYFCHSLLYSNDINYLRIKKSTRTKICFIFKFHYLLLLEIIRY